MAMQASVRAFLYLAFGQALAAKTPLGFKPNLLFLFPDQWRFDWDGLRSFSETPELDAPNLRKYAERGVRFEHAYVPAPVCAPSRACLASGREYDEAGVPDNTRNDYPFEQSTFFSQLQKAGYHTMTTGKDDLSKATQLGGNIGQYEHYGGYKAKELGFSDWIRHSGKEDVVNQFPEPHEYYGYYLNNRTVILENGTEVNAFFAHYSCMKEPQNGACDGSSFPDELYQDNWVALNAIELLDRKPAGIPWFLWVSFPGPHGPFLVTGKMADSVTKRSWPQPQDAKKPDTCPNQPGEPGDGGRCNYAAEIENLDRLFGLVVSKVEELGDMDKTLVVISSDHGEMLGDHNSGGKSKPWEGSASVPLIVFGGSDSIGIPAGGVRSGPVATMDLAGTFMDYAGAEPAVGMTTTSLRKVFEGTKDGVRPFVASGLANWRMAVEEIDGTWYKFICCYGTCTGSPSTVPKAVDGWTQALYDINKDRFDMNDVSEQHPDVVTAMRKRLPAFFGCAQNTTVII